MKRIALLLLLAACSDGPPTGDLSAVPGEIVINLQTSGPAVGAIRFTVKGGDIAQVTAVDPGITVFTTTSGDVVSVIAIGATLRGPLVRLRVPDVRKVSSYRTAVVEMVDTENQKVAVGESYGLEVVQPR
jgi:RecJ-like exonuclease